LQGFVGFGKWPADSYGQDESGKCNSRSGGGLIGYAATYEAMEDIYNRLKVKDVNARARMHAPTIIANATCVDPIIDAADDHAQINDWINDWIMIGFAPHKKSMIGFEQHPRI
jgi:hypothetical protein